MKKIIGTIAKWGIAGTMFGFLAVFCSEVFDNLCRWTTNVLIDVGLRRSQSDWIAVCIWIWSLATFCKFSIDFMARMFTKKKTEVSE